MLHCCFNIILLEVVRELSHFCKMARRSKVVGPRWSISRFFLKKNVRYPIWTCKDPISLMLGTRFSLILGTRWLFSLILGTRFSILGTRIGSLKHLKKTWCIYGFLYKFDFLPVLVITTECKYFRFWPMQIYLNFACNFFLIIVLLAWVWLPTGASRLLQKCREHDTVYVPKLVPLWLLFSV